MGTKQTTSNHSLWRFLIPSLLGVCIFILPISYGDRRTILLAHMSGAICKFFKDSMPSILALLLVATAIASATASYWRPKWLMQHNRLAPLLIVKPFGLLLRLVSASLALLLLLAGSRYLSWSPPEDSRVLHNLLPTLFTNLFLSSFLAPFLLEFGLLELIGTLMAPIMRTFFLLPGRAAVNCVASWIGDGTVGTVMAIREYERGKYTEKEASIVITSFAAVSLTFYATILGQVGLEDHFGVFCLTTISSSLMAAVILSRIPPLARKRSEYITGRPQGSLEDQEASFGLSSWQVGMAKAKQKASTAPSFATLLMRSAYGFLEVITSVLPSVVLISFSSLFFASQYPALLEGIGRPFVPILRFFGVAEAKEASKCLWIGFADMLTPSILAKGIASASTRFIIASLSVTQIIYLSELGALLFGQQKLRISLLELFTLFVLRTLITLPIIIACAHLFL